MTDKGRVAQFGGYIPPTDIRHYSFLDICTLRPQTPETIFFNVPESTNTLEVSVIGFDTMTSITLRNQPVQCPQALGPLAPYPWKQNISQPWHFSTCSLLDIQEIRLCERFSVGQQPHPCPARVVIGMIVQYCSGLQVAIGQVRLDSLTTIIRVDRGVDQAVLALVIGSVGDTCRFLSGFDILPQMQDAGLTLKMPLRGSLIWWFRAYSYIIQHHDADGRITRVFRSRGLRKILEG